MSKKAENKPRRERLRRGLAATAVLTIAATGTVVGSVAPSSAKPAKGKAQLTVTKVTGVPKATNAGARIKVTATVRNAGKVSSPKKSVVLHLSRNAKLDRADTRLGAAPVAKLRPRASRKAAAAVTLPKGVTSGTYYVLACIDGKRCKSARTTIRGTGSSVPDRGTLSGTLNFQRTTPYESGATLSETATADVAMRYIGPFTRPDELLSTGSSYSFGSNQRKDVTAGDCVTTTEMLGSGGGPLTATGDLYNDEIYGSVVLSDLSKLSLTVIMRYTHHTRTTLGGAADCDHSTQDGPVTASRRTNELTLEKVSRTATSITYQVTSARGADSTKSDWEQITGTLTLRLG